MKRKKKLPKRKKRSIFPPNAYIILIPAFLLALVIYFYPASGTSVLGASTSANSVGFFPMLISLIGSFFRNF